MILCTKGKQFQIICLSGISPKYVLGPTIYNLQFADDLTIIVQEII